MTSALPDPETGWAECLAPYPVSHETRDKFKRYHALLIKWQKAINLVAPSTLKAVDTRHFLDSAQLAPILATEMGAAEVEAVEVGGPKRESLEMGAAALAGPLLDIGSGAGFPGLVLALLGVGPVHLVESTGKKAHFLKTVSRETGANTIVHQNRIETLPPFPVAAITARACASITQLLDWSKPFLAVSPEDTKIILLKGATWQEELIEAARHWKMQTRVLQSCTDRRGRILILSRLTRFS